MFTNLIELIRPIITTYGSFGVFVISVLEEVIAPIPSTLTILAAGFFLIPVDASFFESIKLALLVVALPAALGITLGSLFVYCLTYWGGKPLIERVGRWVGVGWNDIEKIEKKFDRERIDEIILFILRATPLIPNSAISAFCGVMRYRVKPFLVITLLGTLIRAFIMALIGWMVGEAYSEYAARLGQIENYIWLVLILGILIFVVRRFRHKLFRRHYADRSNSSSH
ncbi:MAG: VTT domain-containing protein [Anaplasmataceae bacterium]|nr:VTT domain-containing protein [Anaplasmataceae bacterium]